MKTEIKNILVPIDFSETSAKALIHAAFLARLSKAQLTLLHVLPPMQFYYEIPEPVMLVDNHEEVLKIVERKLNDLAEHIQLIYQLKPKCISARGKIAHEIIRVANDEKTDLIVMGTHGAKGFEELFIGSNAHKVVTLANCPVLTIQSHATNPGFRNIVLPIDRSQHSREKVERAIALASLYNSKLHLIGLLDDDDEGEYGKLQIVLDQVQHAVEKAGLDYSRHTVKGDHLASEALKFGEKVNADLIIIMTDHESNLTGIFMGPLAKQIVNHSRIPVMSVKPHYRSFESMGLDGASLVY